MIFPNVMALFHRQNPSISKYRAGTFNLQVGKLRVRVNVRVRQRKWMDFEQETVLKRSGISHLSEVLGVLPKIRAVHTGKEILERFGFESLEEMKYLMFAKCTVAVVASGTTLR